MTFRWLPPGLRPPVPMDRRQEHIFLLVGAAALFAGYDQNVFGLAIPQIQASLHIPENQVGLTVAYFRVAAIAAMLLAASADVMGRRRLLLLTILGQAAFTLLTAFTTDYASFVWAQVATRVFGYAEEMLCFVVIGEEVAAGARGWASGTLSAFDYLGAGVASLVFAAVNLLPYGWRAIYVIGALPLFLVAYLRRRLPETRRFRWPRRESRRGFAWRGMCGATIRCGWGRSWSPPLPSALPSRRPPCWARNICKASMATVPGRPRCCSFPAG
jgi:putative MFS transporter